MIRRHFREWNNLHHGCTYFPDNSIKHITTVNKNNITLGYLALPCKVSQKFFGTVFLFSLVCSVETMKLLRTLQKYSFQHVTANKRMFSIDRESIFLLFIVFLIEIIFHYNTYISAMIWGCAITESTLLVQTVDGPSHSRDLVGLVRVPVIRRGQTVPALVVHSWQNIGIDNFGL